MGLTATALGHLLPPSQRESGYASDLLEQTLAQLREMAGQPLTEAQRLQYLSDVTLASNFLGQIKLAHGDYHHAAELFTDGLSAAHAAADRFTILISLYDLARSRQARGDLDDAADLLRQGPDLATLGRFAFFFVPVWWLWLQFSFYADRHESDDASHRGPFLIAILLGAGLAASASRAVSGNPAGFVVAFAAMRALQLLLYARARRHLPATRRLYGRYLVCFGTGGARWASSLPLSGPPRVAVWTAALAADAAGGQGMLAPQRYVPLNPWHLTERFQLFVLIMLGESVARLISAAALRPWSVPLAVVLTAAVVTLATLWRAWNKSASHRALHGPGPIAWFAAANLPIVAGVAAASAGLHAAILAADGATTIGIGPRTALGCTAESVWPGWPSWRRP